MAAYALAGYIHHAQAQDLAFASNPINNDPATLLAITNNNTAATPIPNSEVNSKVTHLFNKNYKDAANVKWYNNGKGYLAMFDWAGAKAHAAFGKDGYWYYDVRYGTENDLPATVKKTIKSNYVDYSIGKVTEVNVGLDKAWVVNLEDADNLVIARVMDNRLDELAHYTTHAPVKTLHKKARIVIPKE